MQQFNQISLKDKQQQKNSKWRIILIILTTFISVSGGILFVCGSVVYWPTIIVDSAIGGICFVAGSICYLLNDIFSIILQPSTVPWKLLKNLGSFRTLLNMLGNTAFIVGSVFFIPGLLTIVGDDIFIIGSVFLWLPQILACWGLFICTPYTVEFYYSNKPYKKVVILSNILTALGCFCFVVGTVLFKNQTQQSEGYYQQGVCLFIIGSSGFLISSIISIKTRVRRLKDPLRDHHEAIKLAYRRY